jgi:hypothetical protein
MRKAFFLAVVLAVGVLGLSSAQQPLNAASGAYCEDNVCNMGVWWCTYYLGENFQFNCAMTGNPGEEDACKTSICYAH